MDEPDDKGTELKEVVGRSGGGIRHEEAPVLGTNRDDGIDENDRFDALVISLSMSIYNICPVRGGGGGDKSNE